MENLTRLGYGVRGLVYAMVGVLALEVAIEQRGRPADTQGAIAALGDTPLGGVLLYVVLIGLIGYALWGVIRAVFDPWRKGNDAKGIVQRVGFLVSAVSYALLAAATYRLMTGAEGAASNGNQTAQTRATTATILSKPWGPWAIGIAGVIVFSYGLSEIVMGFGSHFDRKFDPYALKPNQRIWMDRIGRFGTAARGLVFAMAGVFLFLAAYHHDPQQAKGIDALLTDLLHQPYGPWLLGVVALGLLAFGVYSVISGIWLRVKR